MHTFKPQRNSLLAMFIGIANQHRSRCPAFHRLPVEPPSILATINPFCFFFYFFLSPKPASSCHAYPTLSLSAASQLRIVCLPSGVQVPASTHFWALGQAWRGVGVVEGGWGWGRCGAFHWSPVCFCIPICDLWNLVGCCCWWQQWYIARREEERGGRASVSARLARGPPATLLLKPTGDSLRQNRRVLGLIFLLPFWSSWFIESTSAFQNLSLPAKRLQRNEE